MADIREFQYICKTEYKDVEIDIPLTDRLIMSIDEGDVYLMEADEELSKIVLERKLEELNAFKSMVFADCLDFIYDKIEEETKGN